MSTALLIAWKDLRQRFRDRSMFLIAFVVPLVLAFIFGRILGDIGQEVTFQYALANQDDGLISSVFVDEVLTPLERQGFLELTPVDSREEALALATEGAVAAAFVIPAGFSAAVEQAQPAEIEVIGNVEQEIGTLIAESVVTSFANEVRAAQLAFVTAVSFDESAFSELDELTEGRALPNPITLEDVSATRKELDAGTFFSAGIAVFFLFFTVQFGVTSLLDERREGTLARLMAAPVRRSAIFAGKLITSYVVGVVSMAVLAVATTLILGAEWGDPFGVALLILAGVLAATSITALIATIAKSSEQASNWQTIVALVLGMLGGSFFPVTQAGGAIVTLSLITPHAWFLRGLGDLQGGGGVSDIGPALAAILAFAAVAGTVAMLRQGKIFQP